MIERLSNLARGDSLARVRATLSGYKLQPWTNLDLCREAAVPLRSLESLLDELRSAGELVDLPVGPRRTILVTSAVVDELEDRVTRALMRLHDANPRQSVIRRSHLLATLPDLPGEALISAILDRLIERKIAVGEGPTVALRAFEPKLSQAERKLKKEIHAAILTGGFSPPEAAELMKTAGSRAEVVPELLAILVDEGKLVKVSPGLYLDAEVDAQMRDQVTGFLRESETMTMSDLRDLLKTSRKYAVPIGEYLDQIRLTHREGDLRRLAVLNGETTSDHE